METDQSADTKGDQQLKQRIKFIIRQILKRQMYLGQEIQTQHSQPILQEIPI